MLVDPGWLFLLVGAAVLAATVLIPAAEDLEEARWLRDRALAVEAHREARLARYGEYLAALEAREPSLVLSLAASQLNEVPRGMAAMPGFESPMTASASVFPALEPPALRLPERVRAESTLSRLAMGERSRLWLIAGGAMCVLLGLLPGRRDQVEASAAS